MSVPCRKRFAAMIASEQINTVNKPPATVGFTMIRKLVPADRAQIRDHLLRLDRESLAMRFGASVSPQFITAYVGRSLGQGSLMHGYFENGRLRATAELRTDGDFFADRAEAAFSVEQGWRRRGIGAGLFTRILRSARNRGIGELTIMCLSWNKPMRALAHKFRAELRLAEGEVVGTILPRRPSPGSVIAELLSDLKDLAANLSQRARQAGSK
jgi:GNAT superfamily N-acetyltransferase